MRLHLVRLESRENPAQLLPGFYEIVRGDGIQSASGVEFANGSFWVTEQTGTVKRFSFDSTTADVILSIPVDSAGERGLLGIALDPAYSSNKFIYVYHTVPAAGGLPAFNRVSRFTVNDANPNDYTVDPSTQQVILDLDPLSSATNHNGGDLVFHPIDNTLFVSVGDNANSENSQSLSTRHGKILRINRDGSIPADNPTTFDGITGSPTGVNRAIYAVGLRNPFRMASFATFGLPFSISVHDVGGSRFEEANFLSVPLTGPPPSVGSNFGWPQTEGPQPAGVPGVTYPWISYAHGTGPGQGIAITGGGFTGRGRFDPAPVGFRGAYFYADLIGRIYANTDSGVVTFAEGVGQPVDLVVGGAVVYLDRQSGRLMSIQYDPFRLPPSGPTVVGSGPSRPAEVLVQNAFGRPDYRFAPFGGFAGGVSVAMGDVSRDGWQDIIVGAGPGGGPHVKVFDDHNNTAEFVSFYAFDPAFTGGVSVAAGDIDFDGRAEVIVGAGAGGGPHVKVFDVFGKELLSFYAFDPNFTGGVSVSAGDLDGDGRAEVIVGAGTGGGPHVKAFRASGLAEVRSFYAFDPTFTGGVNVAAGDTNGDRRADIITAPARGGDSVVRVVRAAETVSIAAFDPRFQGGVRVAFSNGILRIGAGPGGGPHVRWLVGPGFNEVSSFYAFDESFGGGVFVG